MVSTAMTFQLTEPGSASDSGCPVTFPESLPTSGLSSARSLQEQAAEFYQLPELVDLVAESRKDAVLREIAATGTYEQTRDELHAGARLAWRNHARCLGRFSWRSLQLIDARHCRTPEEVAQACREHLEISTNSGKLRAVITVFAPRSPDGDGIRIWNTQLIRYAGYRRPDGSVLGDPLNLRFTDLVQRLGWQGAGTAFDVLPMLVQVDSGRPHLFEVPSSAIFEVPLVHPEFPWFAELELRWHENPAISNLNLEIGGLSYSAAPFSGWYVSSEIGARNLSDEARYNMLPVIAARMGLDTSTSRSLWRDRALLELNQAVLYSFQKSGVHIIDHHAAARQFIAHIDREHEAGRSVPAEWSWINPPMSASTTPTFHRSYDPADFELRPNFVARTDPIDDLELGPAIK
jgi:nitric-oxide synthase